MFTGLCAFPLTPLKNELVDERAFIDIIHRMNINHVDSIGILGSTGNYAYLSREERNFVIKCAREESDLPLIVGISALRLKDIQIYAEDAQKLGANALLLAPMSYQKLNDREVFQLYEQVNNEISIPLCVYDNPSTTQFYFKDDLIEKIGHLSNIKSIKIPPLPVDLNSAQAKVAQLKALLPQDVTLGISGDGFALTGLLAGCDAWYSAIAGLFPESMMELITLIQTGKIAEATAINAEFSPLWALFNHYGSLRVIATAAELLGYAASPCLPLPLMALPHDDRRLLASILSSLNVN